jgi:Tol biopolymer transport system component
MHPVWSPDGRWIAVTKAKYTGIYLVDPSGRDTTIRELTSESAAGYGFLWSKDGETITYRGVDWGPTRGGKTYNAIDVKTGRKRVLPPDSVKVRGTGACMLDSRPSATVAYLDDSLKLWVEVGGKQHLVASDAEYINPSVSPDQTAVLAQAYGGDMYVFELVESSEAVRRVDLGTGERPVWSPDGRQILFFVGRDDGHKYIWAELCLVNRDGTRRVQLTDTADVLEFDPCWSPDGRRVTYCDFRSGGIYVAQLEGCGQNEKK